jgi:hypothetical protein
MQKKVGWAGKIGSELARSLPVNIDLSRQQARSVTSALPDPVLSGKLSQA